MSRSDVLVDADWVEAHLDDPKVVIVEVDEDTSAYEKNHIKNAIRIDWTKDLQDPVRRDFVDQAGFEKLLSAKGIANDTTVVLYGGNNNWFASYAYWYFKLYGHEDVKLLDGGRKKWELDSRDLVDGEVPERAATEYKAKAQDTVDPRLPRRRRGRDRQRRTWSTCVRPTSSAASCSPRRTSRRSSRSVPGHVPTARNIPWSKNANDDGTFKSDDELKELYDEEQVDLAKDTIAYCRIGERSALTWFVLHELLGVENVKNYDGSWTEYGSLVGVPIELGANK